jgi:hypothetical protein
MKFGISKQPIAATAEGWNEYEESSKKASSFGHNLVESFDTMQQIVYWIPDKIKNISYYISNAINGHHVLKTNTKFGSWADLASRIPDSLMLSVIDFIEKECFWMNVAFFEDKQSNMSDGVWKYKNQSYIQRRLFPVKVSSEERAKHGIEYLQFQINSSCKTNKKKLTHPYNKIIAAYWFAKTRYGVDLYDESGFTAAYERDGKSIFGNKTKEKDAAIDKLNELEKIYEEQVIVHCTNLVKYHSYLWT